MGSIPHELLLPCVLISLPSLASQVVPCRSAACPWHYAIEKGKPGLLSSTVNSTLELRLPDLDRTPPSDDTVTPPTRAAAATPSEGLSPSVDAAPSDLGGVDGGVIRSSDADEDHASEDAIGDTAARLGSERARGDTPHSVLVHLMYLQSYEHMGTVQLACRQGCSCTPQVVDAHRCGVRGVHRTPRLICGT